MLRLLLALLLSAALAGPAAASELSDKLRAVLDSRIRPWLSAPELVEAVKAQNARHANLTQAEIDRLDAAWRAEVRAGGGPLTASVLGNALSQFLRARQGENAALIAELFVMDAVGLNVGQAVITTDYFQGDEAKWQRTFLVGPDAVFVDEVEFDDSAKAFQAQISATIVDPADGRPIGAITVGVNVDAL